MRASVTKASALVMVLLSALALVVSACGGESAAERSARHQNACVELPDEGIIASQLAASEAPNVSQEGDTIQASWRVTNEGAAPGKACLIMNRMESGKPVGVESSVVPVPPGSTVEAEVTHKIPDLAPIIWTYTIVLRDGADNSLIEEHVFPVNLR